MKITFMGSGSTVFVRNVLGDSMCSEALRDAEMALYDIDGLRLEESRIMLEALNRNINNGRAKIKAYLGVENRKAALKGADFVINAIQVGGYDPCTITDFEIPKKYGLRQTIADTLGIGGIFRALRTIPVMKDFADDMEQFCPDAWFLNYTNPMSMLTGYMQRYTGVKTIGLCHSVQVCAKSLMHDCGLDDEYDDSVEWKIAGINHMAWLLEISKNGEDLYPKLKKLSLEKMKQGPFSNAVRHKIMHTFGYYVTESSEHNAEYMPYWIKNAYPELIDEYKIPLDEYPRRCIKQIEDWKKAKDEYVNNPDLTHKRSREYASYIMEAIATNKPYKFGGNVINTGLIPNLPANACVEVPCIADASGIAPVYVGELPEQLAALNRTNINPQLLTIEAAATHKKEAIYHAALLDPHTSAELPIDQIIKMCDDLIEAHGDWLPKFN
jgi:glycoside hydrolase family 4